LTTTANNNTAPIDFLASTVPMRTEPANTVEILCRRLDHHAEPADDRERHSFLTPMRLNSSSHSSSELEALVDYFTEQTRGNRNSSQTEGLRRHWIYVLLNLSRVSLQHRWLLVSLGRSSYQQD